MAPLLPGLSDKPELMADVVRAARDAGATHIWANVLYLRPGTREHFMEHLARDWPEMVPLYERLYQGRAYLPETLVKRARDRAREFARQFDVRDRRTVSMVPPRTVMFADSSPAEQLSLIVATDVRGTSCVASSRRTRLFAQPTNVLRTIRSFPGELLTPGRGLLLRLLTFRPDRAGDSADELLRRPTFCRPSSRRPACAICMPREPPRPTPIAE